MMLPFLGIEDDEWEALTSPIRRCSSNGKFERNFPYMNPRWVQALRLINHTTRGAIADLSLFFTLPIEIIYETLTHLHPVDLLNLSRTTKRFRALLMSSNSTWIWSSTFKFDPDLPPCPSDMPHPKWVELLFGPFLCQDCEDEYAEPDASWRRRLCGHCESNRLHSLYSKVLEVQRVQDESRAVEHQESTHNKVQLIADEMKAREGILSGNYPPEWEKVHFFDEDMTTEVKKDLDEAFTAFGTWAETVDNEFAHYYHIKREKARKALTNWLKALGYTKEDISHVAWSYDVEYNILPTSRPCAINPLRVLRFNLPDYKAQIPILLDGFIKKRLDLQHAALVQSRKTSIRKGLQRYSQTLSKELRRSLPSPIDIVLYEPFTSMINNQTMDELDKSQISIQVSSFVERWPPATLEEVAALYGWDHEASYYDRFGTPPYNISSSSFIFKCTFCEKYEREPTSGCIVGWHAAVPHIRCGGNKPAGPPQIDERGCCAATSLLELLELDPLTTLPSELDERDLSFTCLQCAEGKKVLPLLTWRDCIFHFVRAQQHKIPRWKLLSLDDIARIGKKMVEGEAAERDIWEAVANMFSIFD